MKFSEQRDKIFPAFVKAQSAFRKATKDSNNPFFKSKYANLDSYLDGSAEGLQDNDLAVMQDVSTPSETNKVSVSTLLLHSSGQWIESEPTSMTPQDNKPQSYGSTVTYARRYNLSGFLGMGAEDDDGNAGSKKPKEPAKQEGPKRAKVNDTLLKCKTPEDYSKMVDWIVNNYGEKIWQELSGHPTKKGETWEKVFEPHYKRVNKVSPLEEDNESLEKEQEENIERWKDRIA